MNYGRQFIWTYENGWSRYTKSPASQYESLLWFTKSKKYTYHQIREPYKSEERLKHKITKNGKVWTPNPEGKHGGDVWNFPVLAGKRFEKERVNHPTQKPLSISNRIVKHFSSECASAKTNKRKYIGFEINPEYIEIANKRLDEIHIGNIL